MFRFEPHLVDVGLPAGRYGQTVLADLDNDGRLEYIVGQQGGDIFWYAFNGPERWQRRLLGTDSPADVGAVVLDVDGDGWLDVVVGGVWYRNSRQPGTPFDRVVFDSELAGVHDVVLADLDGDGRLEILTMSDRNDLRWYRIPADPTEPWPHTRIGDSVHAGLAVGDLTGNGSLDVVRTNVWFENVAGDGTAWVEHPLPYPPQDPSRLTMPFMVNATIAEVCDLDRDGVNDIVMVDNEMTGGRLFWLENLAGDGSQWSRHDILVPSRPWRGAFHSLHVGDLDGDGDLDIFSCEMEDIRGEQPPRFYIWENVDGVGGEWREHVILDMNLGGHAAVVGDLTGKGRPDIVAKPWEAYPHNAVDGQSYVLFLENVGLEPA